MENDSKNDSKQASDSEVIETIKILEDEVQYTTEIETVRSNPLASQARGGRKDYSNQRYEKDAEISGAVTRLARLGLSKSAVAVACRLTPNELTKWYAEEYAAGQAGMQEVVARGLMEQAMAGNPQVLMYLGKAKLGWTESNTVEHVGTVNAVVSAKPLSRDEFERKYINNDAESDDEL